MRLTLFAYGRAFYLPGHGWSCVCLELNCLAARGRGQEATKMQTPTAIQALKLLKPGAIKGFDPQPDPPKQGNGLLNPGALKGFNPQPDPPRPPEQLLGGGSRG